MNKNIENNVIKRLLIVRKKKNFYWKTFQPIVYSNGIKSYDKNNIQQNKI
jgi:hypothetical protein